MKREEIKALFPPEIEIPKEVIDSIMEINGKDIENAKASVTAAKDKEVATLTAERDNFKSQLATAEDTLKKFGDKTPEQIQQEIAEYKKKAEDAQADFTRQITERDQKDWITKKLDEYGVASPFARKQLASDVMAEDGLKWKDGSFLGFDDFMKSAKEKDAGLYQTKEEKDAAEKAKKQEEGAPKFTKTGEQNPPGGNGGFAFNFAGVRPKPKE